jgi:glycosyltransferase involved in cell wall biosynthesis
MHSHKPKVLMVAPECNPEWASVPLVGYKFYDETSKLVDITLVTHERNRSALEAVKGARQIFYISEGPWLGRYYAWVSALTNRGGVNWPLYHMLTFPLYASFNRKVYRQFAGEVRAGAYDIVHAITPMMPRFPVKLVQACKKTPFVLGPVNGGVPFPKGFEATARKEFAHFNFLRALGRYLVPGYRQTYTQASKILVGSSYTLGMLKDLFGDPQQCMELFYENGIDDSFQSASGKDFSANGTLNVLFVGRLVPYKGADMLLDGLAQLPAELRANVRVKIVGDGSERANLEAQCASAGLTPQVEFVGWVKQDETRSYYEAADLFCFPSIREFGGAVALEAMACGLPCAVVNNGGIGEYVTLENGYKLEPISRAHIVQGIRHTLERLLDNKDELRSKATLCLDRVAEFRWPAKAQRMADIYRSLLH